MGAERVVRWGPPALAQVVTDQLERHGLGSADAAACARELAAAVGPAARASSFVDLGGCRFLDGDISGALAAWQQAIISGQTAPAARALFNLGLLHEHLGLYDDAVQRFDAAESHRVAPYSALATLGRARALHRSGDNDRAIAALARHADRLMEDDGDSALLGETLLGLGDVAEAAGQLGRAEQAYRAAMASDDATIREQASLSLVDVLRFIGHDEEAQQIVEDAGLSAVDPGVALDRIELLVRLGRFDEAETVLDEIDGDTLAVADQFRLTTTQIDLGRVNDAIDILEALAGQGAAETRARAAYRLGEVYLTHDMPEPAATMFGNVRGLQPGYWADKASLALGDLAMADGRHRIAAAHWADAAASRIESVSTSARDRLVEAVDATPAAPASPVLSPMVDEPAVALVDAEWDDDDHGPATEAVDMVSVLDEVSDADAEHDAEEPAVDDVTEQSHDLLPLPPMELETPGEITPVAGVLMALPDADAVDVVVPAEPLAPEPVPAEQAELIEPAAPVEPIAPPEPVAPAAPTVIPLRRRSTVSTDAAMTDDVGPPTAPPINDEVAFDVPHTPSIDEIASDEPATQLDDLAVNSDAGDPDAGDPDTGDSDEADSDAGDAADDAPTVIKLGRSASTAEDDPVIDLRESEAAAPNPYAALAPEALDGDPMPSTRNPYAELAPNFGRDPLRSSRGDGSSRADGDDEPGPSTFSRFA